MPTVPSKVAMALAEAFGCEVNELPPSFVLSWYEQKAVYSPDTPASWDQEYPASARPYRRSSPRNILEFPRGELWNWAGDDTGGGFESVIG